MKRRFSDEQIIGMIKEYVAGVKAQELCRRYGISDATFYKYKAKFGEEYSLITELTSYAANQGDGTGVEIIFGPWESTLLKYQNSKKIAPVIPEPPTMILLMAGSILMRRPRPLKGSSHLTIKSDLYAHIFRFRNIFRTTN